MANEIGLIWMSPRCIRGQHQELFLRDLAGLIKLQGPSQKSSRKHIVPATWHGNISVHVVSLLISIMGQTVRSTGHMCAFVQLWDHDHGRVGVTQASCFELSAMC